MTTKKELLEEIVRLHDKYDDLVRYARRNIYNYGLDGVIEKLEEIEAKWPKECDTLNRAESDWQHGFNSGMLAAIRYLMDYAAGEKEFAEDNFPDLDT